MTKRRRSPAVAVALAFGVVAAATALGAGSQQPVVPYPAGGQTLYGVRPTAIGLPQVGESGTVGADALATSLRAYHDSGAYQKDLAAVDGAAERYVDRRLTLARTHRRVCATSYERVGHIKGHGVLYRRVRSCRELTQRFSGKPAIVLDIDETSLSNYADLAAHNFAASALVLAAVQSHGTAIKPTLGLYKDAISRGVAVFFVTGRPAAIDSITKANLRHAGYDKGWAAIYEKPVIATTERFKSSTRAAIEKRGYDIVANVGDQQSDLDGGHVARDFKLPDPFYFISD